MITVAIAGDLHLKVKECDNTVTRAENQKPVVLREEIFLISKEVIKKGSSVLDMLHENHRISSNSNKHLTVEDDPIHTMEICLRALHNTISGKFKDVAIDEMWNIAVLLDKYNMDVTRLYEWFGEWYNRHGKQHAFDCLLYPTWRYDQSTGFLNATRAIVYFCEGHVQEHNPTKHRQLYLESRITQQLNAAKGRLRTVLHRNIYKPIKELLKASCRCKEKTVFGYLQALDRTGVWPFEEVWHKKPVEEILDSLDAFSYDPAAKDCRSCRKNYTSTVKSAVDMTRKYFDGLCLDCMDRSKPKTKDEDSDYWQHNKLRVGEWDHNCRAKHGQPTWYFSFMGRKERRDYLKEVGLGRRR